MKITVINTGGTFNKRYNPIKGQLEVARGHKSLKKIMAFCYNVEFEIIDILAKDSLDMTTIDRQFLVQHIKRCKNKNIIVIHGTDTMTETAQFVRKKCDDKKIIFTGAMVPMSIDEVEATMNFSLAVGFLSSNPKKGIYVAMHGVVKEHTKLKKNRRRGKFLVQR